MTNRNKAILAIILSGILGGGNSVFNKLGLKEFPSFLFIFLRFFITVLMLLPFLPKKQLIFNHNLKKLFLLSLLPVINIVLFTYGVQRTTANIATMIYTGTPIVVAIWSYFLFKEKFKTKKVLGILIGFLGTITIILIPVLEHKTNIKADLIGNLAIFIGMIFFASYSVFSKKFHEYYSPTLITFIFALTCAIVVIPLAVKDTVNNPLLWQHITLSGWVGLLYVGILGSIALYLLFQYAIKYGGPLVGSLNSYLQPISGVIWAAVLLHESISPVFIFGSLVTIVGVWLVTTGRN